MNRNKAEQWLSRAMDGELNEDQLRTLEAYLDQHPEVALLRDQWTRVGALAREAVVPLVQTPEAAWQDVQRAIRLQEGQGTSEKAGGLLWGWKWAGGVAVACMAGLLLWIGLRASPEPLPMGYIAQADRTEVEWVETELPDAISMVYEDAESGVTVIWVLTEETRKDDEHAG